jgi:ATP:cob(I)alamin adenosyltransferase
MNCDVSNEADILTTHLGQAISFAVDEFRDELIEVSQLMYNFMAALRQNREFTRQNVEYVTNLELKYKSMLTSKKIFVIPTGNKLSSTLHVCRAYAKKVSRLYFEFESSTEFNSDEMSDFINTLSTMFYNMAKYVNQESSIEEIDVRR